MPHDIFLSYSRKDSEVMRQVRDDLRSAGLTVWTDEGIEAGTPSWKRSLQDAIDGANCVVVFLSPDAKESEWVGRELDYASARRLSIFPLMLRGDEASAVPFMLIGYQFIDFRPDYSAGLQSLLHVLREHLQAQSTTASSPATSSHTLYNLPDEEALDPWNIFGQLRFVGWLFFNPAKIITRRALDGEQAIRQTAAWTVAMLAVLPFLMTVAGAALGTMENASDNVYLVLAGILYIGEWLVTGWLGWRRGRIAGMVLLVIATALTLAGHSLVTVLAGVPTTQSGEATTGFVLLTTCILTGAASGLAFRFANSATGTLAGTVIGTLIFTTLSGMMLGVTASAAGLIMVVLAFSVSTVLENNLRSGRPSRLGYVMLAIVSINLALMIWGYFLGGWRILSGQ